jgi:flagellar hook-associated protein 1 FlgK
MTDLYGILNVAKGALHTKQRAIDVTAHNIANVNTPGYSRQRVNMTTTHPLSSEPGQLGTGVQAAEIQRMYDSFLGIQINTETQSLGKWEAEKDALQQVEMIFDESSGYGLSQALNEFWNAWQDLVNEPSGPTERAVLLAKSETLTTIFNKVSADLKQIQKDMDARIQGSVQEINGIAGRIADLNQQIVQIEAGGQNANDLRDERDLLLTELSSMVDISTSEGSDGKVTVLLGGGRPLVQNETTWDLSNEANASGHQDILWLDGFGGSVNITETISDGALKGCIQVRDVSVPSYSSRLDAIAAGIIQEVNNLHSSGFGLDGTTGNDFFIGTSASDIACHPSVLGDPRLIAAAGSASGVPGDNSIAIAIADLQNDLTMDGNSATFGDYYHSIIAELGGAVQEAAANYDHQSAMVDQLTSARESVSGVSLEEEMVNLIKFQHAYEAAAKLVSTTDELLETVIGMV